MTARILAFPTRPDPEQQIAAALDAFAAAAVTSMLPAPFVRALQLGDGQPESLTVDGQPVTVSATGPRMAPDVIVDAWRRLRAAAPVAGSHIHITGARLLVECPDLQGGAA